MKISASLYSNTSRNQEELITALDRCFIDFFHIDAVPDQNVFENIRTIKKLSETPIDLHIISSQPEDYFDKIEELAIDQVAIQFENLAHDVELPPSITKWGIAISSDTPIQVFEKYASQCAYILIMTTTPGKSGGKFQKENFQRIRQFRNMFPSKEIFVDGGVNDEVAFILRILGVTGIISGSYLVNHQSIGEAILHLKSSIIHSHYLIKDFMIPLNDAPFVLQSELSVASVIQSIDKGDLGFTLIRANDQSLFGLVSNADLRKGLLKNLSNLNKLSVEQIVNRSPITINEHASISELLAMIKKANFLISFIPVVDESNNLKGALSFAHLIRSES